MTQPSIAGKPVEAHYLAVFNGQQELLGDALHLDPPALIMMQAVGEKLGFQLKLARDIVIPLNRPDIVGFSFFDVRKQFLVAFSIAGNPEMRKENEEYVITSRYIVMAPRKQPS